MCVCWWCGSLGRWWEGGVEPLKGSHMFACILTHLPSSAPKRVLFLWPLFTSLLGKLPGAYVSWHQDWQTLLQQHRRGIFEAEQMGTEEHRPQHGAVLCQARVRGQCVS